MNEVFLSHYEWLELLCDFDPRTFPNLERALPDEPMYSGKIEWLVPSNVGFRAEFNYAQIQRNPFEPRVGIGKHEALRRFLEGIDHTLEHGIRQLDIKGPEVRGFCGGWRELLFDRYDAEAPYPEIATMTLRTLRKPALIRREHGYHEWVGEFSLQARLV